MRKSYLITTVLSVIFALVILVIVGCVSTQEYQDLENRNARTEQELEALKKTQEQSKRQIGDMEKEIKGLRDDKTSADEEIVALRDAIDKQKSLSESEKAALKREAEELRALSEKEKEALKATYDSLVKSLKDEIDQGKIEVEQVRGRLTMKVTEELFFETGKADIKPQGEDVLRRIGAILKKIPEKNIRVEGHTDNVQIGPSLRSKYPTNWELGSARATNVVRFLQENAGIDPLRLSAVSYGEYRPIASNRTERGKARNRRIEIILIDRDLDLAKKMKENLK
ncbi:MAG: OmpA family protein [Spirochaetota bacterium]|nr:MAG: OmpA family protein [Spirochaetota bacterium]